MTRPMPTQFPCLVRAIYSFPGESKGDLGFVQGDLIECLNTGDGQWWMGRLKRNKAMGVFPSNYVEVVDDRPSSKGSSSGSSRPTSSRSQLRPSSRQSQMRPGSRQSDQRSLRSFQSYGNGLNVNFGRPSSSSSAMDRGRQIHPARSMTSMSQYRDDDYNRYRSPSPSFYNNRRPHTPYEDEELNYPVDEIYDSPQYDGRRSVSPIPVSPGGNLRQQTPSPLRWAMQDLMEALSPPVGYTESGTFDSHHRSPSRISNRPQSRQSRNYPPNNIPGAYPPEDLYDPDQDEGQYMYPADMRPPPLLNYVDRMESRLHRFQNYHYSSPERSEPPLSPARHYDHDRSPSRISHTSYTSDLRPHSSHSMVDKPLPTSPTFKSPPLPPPHQSRRRFENGSVTSHSTKHSIFSATASDYSTAASSMSASSAGSAGSFARKKALLQRQQQQQQTQPPPSSERAALSVLPRSNTNSTGALLKRRKSYGSSLKKTIGKLLNTSPSKPAPGSITDHGDKVIEWQNVRRDVNRANTPSAQERNDHRDRIEMSEGVEVVRPIELLQQIVEGDESATGTPILPDEAVDISRVNFSLVDRATKLINQVPGQYLSSPAGFAKGVICRPYTSEIQRLRAIFVFLAEKFTWEPLHPSDFMEHERSEVELGKLLETKKGTAEEIAWCFWEMCQGCGIHAEVIPGYLKAPFSEEDIHIVPQQNHFWNAVVVNGEWRMVDCSLASPTHPSRPPPATKSFESFYFLARPSEFLYTHIPLGDHLHQHVLAQDIISPPVQLALPYACPAYFQYDLCLQSDYDYSQTRLDGLQVACVDVEVHEDVECVAEVESQAYARDLEGDLFESGEVIKEAALAQALWLDDGQRRVYRIKAFLRGEGVKGTLKVYAGKKGLMTSAQDNPHRLALTIPLAHSGTNPPFTFVTRHPTPHAQRHDLYIRQPQCKHLKLNQTYIFSVLQSPSSLMSSETAKPAKLAIQTPGGKLVKLSNRVENDHGAWETLIKCSEKGSWKGLVLGATARWCVFAEWVCQG